MTLGGLVLAALRRNWLRSFFTFAAIVTAFCLFGALATMRYEREGPSGDRDVLIVEPDGPKGLPVKYEDAIRSITGVKTATGVSMFAAANVKTPTSPLILFAADPATLLETFPSMNIAPDVAAQWRATRIGAVSDARTAMDMGWKVHDRISLPFLMGMRTGSGQDHMEVSLVGLYTAASAIQGLVIRHDYLNALFPQYADFTVMFARPTGEARAVAERIDTHFEAEVTPTLSQPLYDARLLAARDASTVALLITGALAVSFFTMVLIVTNALTQSVRERLGEMAILAALGFPRVLIVALVMAEPVALFTAGAVLGLALSNLGLHFDIGGMHSRFESIPGSTIISALAYAVVAASLSVLLPLWELSKLRVAEALTRQ